MTVRDLPTPAAVVDLDRVERNCARMSARASELGVRLRPHVKTHKTIEAARLQVAGHFGGITVSTLAEASAFAAAGFGDITYAVPLAPARAAELVAIDATVHALVDSTESADALAAAAKHRDRVQSVFLKVDCGYGRAGVDPHAEFGMRLAERLARDPALDFRGVLAHGGHSYLAKNRQEIAVVAAEERDVTVGFADRLRRAGIDVPEVSIGSTPTIAVVDRLDGVTEVRPGNYVFFDCFQAAIGSCDEADRAFSVLATVIGAYPSRGTAVLDTGALALSKDRGATHVTDDPVGYGIVTTVGGKTLDLELFSLSQEHGLVRGAAVAGLCVGDRLRVFPNHSCLSAAMFERFHVCRGDEVIEIWGR